MTEPSLTDRLHATLPAAPAARRDHLIAQLKAHATARLGVLACEQYGPLLSRASGGAIVLAAATENLSAALGTELWPDTAEAAIAAAGNLVRRGLAGLARALAGGPAAGGSSGRAALDRWRAYHDAAGRLPDPSWTAGMLDVYAGVAEAEFGRLIALFGPAGWVLASAAGYGAAALEARVRVDRLRAAEGACRPPAAGPVEETAEVLLERIGTALRAGLPAAAGADPGGSAEARRRWADQVLVTVEAPRRWVGGVYEAIFPDRDPPVGERRRFYRLAATAVAGIVEECLRSQATPRGRRTTAGRAARPSVAPGPAERRRERLARRHRRYVQLAAASAAVRDVYPLVRYAGRQTGEVAALLDLDDRTAEARVRSVLFAVEEAPG